MREAVGGRVRISWVPAGGLTQYIVCNAVDISESGMRVASPEPLPVGQYVHVQFDSIGLRGNASVRCCLRKSVRHQIGLEFSSGVTWKKSAA
jgi:hypothetical protein